MHLRILVPTLINSNRLTYVLDTIFKEWMQLSYSLHLATENEHEADPCLYYGATNSQNNSLAIPSCGLLYQEGIDEAFFSVSSGTWQGLPTLFPVEDAAYHIPFDLFAAVFWLISRYEEYNHLHKDDHDRYRAECSWAYAEGCLQQVIVDRWVEQLRKLLMTHFGMSIVPYPFSLKPTYDIDIAYSYLHKGKLRTIGANAKLILQGKLGSIADRIAVMQGKEQDPFDSFKFLSQLHFQLGLVPQYFVLCAAMSSRFDKCNKRESAAMKKLIHQLSQEGHVGIHPSYYTMNDDKKFLDEKQFLEKQVHHPITKSRQHYFRCAIPETLRLLAARGIEEEYSMGYATHNGFRAGTARPYFFFDILEDKRSTLQIFPCYFMDSTAHFIEYKNVRASFDELDKLTREIQAQGGVAITVFHNFSLGTDPAWDGWSAEYAAFLRRYL